MQLVELVVNPAIRQKFLVRAMEQRPEEYARCSEGAKDSVGRYAERGFAINLGDAGMGVFGVGVASKIRYGSRWLLFNCAVPGSRTKKRDLIETIGPSLAQFVTMANRQAGLR